MHGANHRGSLVKTYRRTCFPRHVADPVRSADVARINSAFCSTLRPLKDLKSLKIVRELLSHGSSMNERGTCDVIGPARGHFLVPSVSFLCRIVCKEIKNTGLTCGVRAWMYWVRVCHFSVLLSAVVKSPNLHSVWREQFTEDSRSELLLNVLQPTCWPSIRGITLLLVCLFQMWPDDVAIINTTGISTLDLYDKCHTFIHYFHEKIVPKGKVQTIFGEGVEADFIEYRRPTYPQFILGKGTVKGVKTSNSHWINRAESVAPYTSIHSLNNDI